MSDKYEIEGVVKCVMDTQKFDSGFTKREFVIVTEEKYPQSIKFEVIKDKCAMLDDVRQDARVRVSFNLRGNEYNDKFYVSVQAWKIETIGQGAYPAATGEALDDSDLPF